MRHQFWQLASPAPRAGDAIPPPSRPTRSRQFVGCIRIPRWARETRDGLRPGKVESMRLGWAWRDGAEGSCVLVRDQKATKIAAGQKLWKSR